MKPGRLLAFHSAAILLLLLGCDRHISENGSVSDAAATTFPATAGWERRSVVHFVPSAPSEAALGFILDGQLDESSGQVFLLDALAPHVKVFSDSAVWMFGFLHEQALAGRQEPLALAVGARKVVVSIAGPGEIRVYDKLGRLEMALRDSSFVGFRVVQLTDSTFLSFGLRWDGAVGRSILNARCYLSNHVLAVTRSQDLGDAPSRFGPAAITGLVKKDEFSSRLHVIADDTARYIDLSCPSPLQPDVLAHLSPMPEASWSLSARQISPALDATIVGYRGGELYAENDPSLATTTVRGVGDTEVRLAESLTLLHSASDARLVFLKHDPDPSIVVYSGPTDRQASQLKK